MMTPDARGVARLCVIGAVLLVACTTACIPGTEKGAMGEADHFVQDLRDQVSALSAEKDDGAFLLKWFRFVSETYGVEPALSKGGTYVIGQGNLLEEVNVGGGRKAYLVRTADERELKLEQGGTSIVYCNGKGASKLHRVASEPGTLLVASDNGFMLLNLKTWTMRRVVSVGVVVPAHGTVPGPEAGKKAEE